MWITKSRYKVTYKVTSPDDIRFNRVVDDIHIRIRTDFVRIIDCDGSESRDRNYNMLRDAKLETKHILEKYKHANVTFYFDCHSGVFKTYLDKIEVKRPSLCCCCIH
jgi:hypothetical protein